MSFISIIFKKKIMMDQENNNIEPSLEGFASFIEMQAAKLNLYIRVGKFYAHVHSVDEYDGMKYLFGWWTGGVLTGVNVTPQQYKLLQAFGKAETLDAEFYVEKVTKEEYEKAYSEMLEPLEIGQTFMYNGKPHVLGEPSSLQINFAEQKLEVHMDMLVDSEVVDIDKIQPVCQN